MISQAAVGKVAKTSSLLMLLVVMTVVPLFVYSTVPRASAWFTSSATSTATTTFSGRAIGVLFTTPPPAPVTTTFADTGQLPTTGGTRDATVLPVTLTPLFTTGDVVLSITMGSCTPICKAESQVDTANIELTIPALESAVIKATSIMATSIATCTSISGSSSIAGLTIGTQSFTADGTVGQTVSTPAGSLVINEQFPTSNGITVNAFDLTTASGFHVIISSAESDITCASPCQQPAHDFVTGGGEERGSSGDKAQFGFAAGHEDDTSTPPSGHMTYTDHLAGVKVLSTDVTSYSIDALNQRTFGGHANYNGASGYTYKAIVQDNGGVGLDTFSISVFDPSSVLVYTNSGILSAGNIGIHK